MRVKSWIIVAAIVAPRAALADGLTIMPGQWEIASTVQSIDMPGASPGIAAAMTGKTTTVRHCVTPEDAARGPHEMTKANKACTFTRHSLVGGKFESEMTCKQGGGTMTATSRGTYSATEFLSTARSIMSGGMSMTMTSTTSGRRIGACK